VFPGRRCDLADEPASAKGHPPIHAEAHTEAITESPSGRNSPTWGWSKSADGAQVRITWTPCRCFKLYILNGTEELLGFSTDQQAQPWTSTGQAVAQLRPHGQGCNSVHFATPLTMDPRLWRGQYVEQGPPPPGAWVPDAVWHTVGAPAMNRNSAQPDGPCSRGSSAGPVTCYSTSAGPYAASFAGMSADTGRRENFAAVLLAAVSRYPLGFVGLPEPSDASFH